MMAIDKLMISSLETIINPELIDPWEMCQYNFQANYTEH